MAPPQQPMIMDYSDRAPALLGVMITGLAISLVILPLRFYTRVHIVRKVGADDWLALVSFVLLIVAFSLLGSATYYGLGRHAATIDPPTNVSYAMKLTWMAFQFTPTAEATGKISVAILLMRVTTSKAWKWFFIVLIALNIGINIGMMFSILMACKPLPKLWNPMIAGHCNIGQRNVMTYFQGGSAAISDLVLAIAPIILLWKVQINLRSKLLLCGLLSIGFFTAAAGFIRVGWSFQTYSEETNMDPTWGLMDFIIWKCVELGLSVIVGCLPTLRPLFDGRVWSRISSRPTKNSYGTYGSSNNGTVGSKGMRIHKSSEIQIDWSQRSAGGSSVDDEARIFK